MVRTVQPAQARLPQDRAEDGDGQEEEDACDLKPENSADAAKRLEKAAHATGSSAGHFAGGLSRSAGLLCLKLAGRLTCLPARALRTRSLSAGSNALPGNASGDAETDAEGATDGLRFHFVLMVTAGVPARLCTDAGYGRVALRASWK